MNSGDWHAWRARGLGASDIAAAHTGRYGGAYRVVAQKLGHVLGDQIDPALAARGHRWEEPIADAVHVLTGYWVIGEQMMVTSGSDPRWRATIDGLLHPHPEISGIDEAEALIEIKTSSVHTRPAWGYYTAQVQWQMHVCGKARALLAIAKVEDVDDWLARLELHWVDRDDFEISVLVDLAETLWGHIEAGTLPAPDEHTDVADVKTVNAEVDPDQHPIDLTPIHTTLAEFEAVKVEAETATARQKELEAVIRAHMGGQILADDGRWRVRVGEPVRKFTSQSEDTALLLHPEYGRTVLDRTRFKTEHPAEYEDFKVPTPDRRLTTKEIS